MRTRTSQLERSILGGACVALLLLGGCGQSGTRAGKPAKTPVAKNAKSTSPQPTATASTPVVPSSGESDQRNSPPDKAEPYDVRVASASGRVAASGSTQSQAPSQLSDVAVLLEDPQVAELTLPPVVLTRELAASCKVQVGDSFPDLKLSDLTGQAKSLNEEYGKKLTVVCFWDSGHATSLVELADLAAEVFQQFTSNGVSIVGINCHDQPILAKELSEHAGAKFTIFSDPQGVAYDQVATRKLPRTYLLDPRGQILWLDVEYSRTTRCDLAQAIRFCLNER